MNPEDEPDHIKAYAHSSKHRDTIEGDTQCGCFYCLKIFPPSEITKWVAEEGEQQTAVCPHCSLDSVIGTSSGFPITEEFRNEMCEYWFASDPERGKKTDEDPGS